MNINNKLHPHVTPTQATVVGSKHSCHYTIPAPMLNLKVKCCGEDPWLRSVHFPLPPPPPPPPQVFESKQVTTVPYYLQQSVDFLTSSWGFQTHQKFPNFIFNLHGYQPCLSVFLVATVWSCHTTSHLSAQWGRERDQWHMAWQNQTNPRRRFEIQNKMFLGELTLVLFPLKDLEQWWPRQYR